MWIFVDDTSLCKRKGQEMLKWRWQLLYLQFMWLLLTFELIILLLDNSTQQFGWLNDWEALRNAAKNTYCTTILHGSHHICYPADHCVTASHSAAYSWNLASRPFLFSTPKIFFKGYQFSSFRSALEAYKWEQYHKMCASRAVTGGLNFSLSKGQYIADINCW
jgi:hypothetical protein